jgi:surface antigen
VNRLDCREYTHNVWIGGRLRVVKGTACREPDGVWRIVG